MVNITTEKAIEDITAMGFRAFGSELAAAVVRVSAEEGDGAADYYNEGAHLIADAADEFGWTPEQVRKMMSETSDTGISKKLESWAEANGLFWEWESAGAIVALRA